MLPEIDVLLMLTYTISGKSQDSTIVPVMPVEDRSNACSVDRLPQAEGLSSCSGLPRAVPVLLRKEPALSAWHSKAVVMQLLEAQPRGLSRQFLMQRS